jgi:hypothetical protein
MIMSRTACGYLSAGPLMGLISQRPALIARMAAELARGGIPATDERAARTLFNAGYLWLDAALLAGEARALAERDHAAATRHDGSARRVTA